MSNEREITKKMLEKLREGRAKQAYDAAQQFITEEKENDNFLTRSKILMKEAVDSKKKVITEEETDDTHKKTLKINKDTPMFGDIRDSQEETIRKTVGEDVRIESMIYYPDAEDITINGKITSMNIKFQYRLNDPSAQGVYLWADAFQLTEENVRTIGKIRDAFMNFKDSLNQDATLMDKLKKYSERD